MIKSNKVVLIGYGGHAISVISAIKGMKLEIVGYIDALPKNNDPFTLDYLGNDDSYLSNPNSHAWHFCALGDNSIRQRLQEKYVEYGVHFINVIHKSAFLEPSVKMGQGIFVGAMAYIGGFASLADGAIVNNHVNIDHETKVGRYTHIAPNSCLTGNVNVGDRAFIGSGSCVIPNVTIGADAIVGAGSIVVKNIEKGQLVYGNPAK